MKPCVCPCKGLLEKVKQILFDDEVQNDVDCILNATRKLQNGPKTSPESKTAALQQGTPAAVCTCCEYMDYRIRGGRDDVPPNEEMDIVKQPSECRSIR